MKHETMSELWKSFWEAVKPANAPEVQRVEMRRAFMAGAWCLLQAMKCFDDNVSEDEGAAHLKQWEKELEEFIDSVKAGRN